MKTCILLTALTIPLFAQAPGPQPVITGDTVIAQVDGKGITAEQIREFLQTAPPQLAENARKNPAEFITQLVMTHYIAAEGEKHNLADESPWKEQIAAAREQILVTAMVTHERNNYTVSNDQAEAYYKSNLAKYQKVHVRDIKIAFKPAVAASAAQDLKAAAEAAVLAAHASTNRTEAEALKLATEIAGKARGGEDFAKLVEQYSDDADTKATGGDFGEVKNSSSYTEEIKKAVLPLKAGDVTSPVRDSAAFYIFRVEEKITQPLIEVHEEILQKLKENHRDEYLGGLYARFRATIDRPDFFFQLNAAPVRR